MKHVLASIKTRLTLWYLLIVTVLLAFWGFTAYILVAQGLSGRNMAPVSIRISEIANNGNNASATDNTIFATPRSANGHESLIVGFSLGAKAIAAYGNNSFPINMITPDGPVVFNIPPIGDLPANTDVVFSLYRMEGEPATYRLMTVYQPGADMVLNVFARVMLLSILPTILLAGFLGFFLVRKMLQPVDRITSAAGEISSKNLSERLKISSKDEIGRLAATMNHMFDRLESAFKREKQFTADMSHELGTPLSIIHGEAELALQQPRNTEDYQRTVQAILEKTKHMSSIVQRLLFLARDESNQNIRLENVNLTELLSELAQDAEVLCEIKNIAVSFNCIGNPMVKGDLTLLRELFLNIIDNAVKYTPEEGKITISLAEKDGCAVISIADTGIGIAVEHLPNLFRRFYRVDDVRSRNNGGVGLGLAICQRITEFHSGRITVESEVGKGSIFMVLLPL